MTIPNLLNSKKIILGILTILGSILLINNYLLTSTLKIKIGSTVSDQKITLKVTDMNGKIVASQELAKAKSGKFRLPIGSFNISASQEDSETIAQSSVVRFKSREVELNIVPQQAVSKIGSESLGCDTLVDNIFYSYSCAKESRIFRHNNTPGQFIDPIPLLSGESQLPIASLYRGGMLARFGNSDNSESAYLNFVDISNNRTRLIKQPQNFDAESGIIIVDEVNNLTNQRFLLVDKSGVIYSYKDVSDDNPKKLQLPENGDLQAPISLLGKDYSLYNDKLVIYVGKTDLPGENKDAIEAQSKTNRSFLYVAGLDQPAPDFKILKLPVKVDNNDIQLIDSSRLAVIRGGGLYIYTIDDNEMNPTAFFANVSNVTSGSDGSAWFLKDAGIYKYQINLNQAVKVFHSPNLDPSRIINLGKQTIFNAFVKNDKLSTLHGYLITDRAADKLRLEDKLPYTVGSGLPIIKMDYIVDKVTVQLSLTSLGSDKRTGQVSYDQSEFDSAKQKILERLQKDGFDLGKLQVIFTN